MFSATNYRALLSIRILFFELNEENLLAGLFHNLCHSQITVIWFISLLPLRHKVCFQIFLLTLLHRVLSFYILSFISLDILNSSKSIYTLPWTFLSYLLTSRGFFGCSKLFITLVTCRNGTLLVFMTLYKFMAICVCVPLVFDPSAFCRFSNLFAHFVRCVLLVESLLSRALATAPFSST